jgi:hypothetical protein
MITVHYNRVHDTLTISQLEDPAALTMSQVRPTTSAETSWYDYCT